MYIDAQFRAAKLPARTLDPRFSPRPLASSLVVHALIAAALIVLGHRTILRIPEQPPSIPMVFLPPAPASVAPQPPKQAQPPVPQVTPAPPPPEPALPPIPQPAPPPPPVVQDERPEPKPKVEHRHERPRHERHERRPVEHRVPPPRELREPAPETQEPLAPAEPAPAPRAAPQIIETGPVVPPRPLSEAAGNRPPDYPAQLRARGVQGLVLLRVYVTAGGRAASVSVIRSSGSGRLDESAAEAVRGWRFIPATRGGRPIPGIAEVPVNFQLSG